MHNKKIKYFFMSAGKYVKLVKFEKDLYFLSKLPLESWIFFFQETKYSCPNLKIKKHLM